MKKAALSEQKLVTKIKRELIRHYGTSKGTIKEAKKAAETIMSIIAPHLRGEFPENKVEEIITWLYGVTDAAAKLGKPLILDPIVDVVFQLERLWNGDQEPTKECSFCLGTGECQGGDACHGSMIHGCPICEGTVKVCPTCGGDEEVVGGFHQLDTLPCPDCKPKCEHEAHRIMGSMPKCRNCGVNVDQRKKDNPKVDLPYIPTARDTNYGLDHGRGGRRKENRISGAVYNKSSGDWLMRIYSGHHKYYEDRRETDRRKEF